MANKIVKAHLFANVAKLMAWKKSSDKHQVELIAVIDELQSAHKTTLKGCEILMKTDTQLMIRTDNLEERINIINKRIRRLEEAVQRILPR